MHPLKIGPTAVRQSWDVHAGGPVPAPFAAGGTLRLGTEAYPDTVTQARNVAGMLRGVAPGLEVTVQVIAGSPAQGAQAAPGGEPGAEAGRALLAGEADAVVCRLADVPLASGLVNAAFPVRDDPRYCVVMPAGSLPVRLDRVPVRARVAVAGAGCAEQLAWRRTDLEISAAGPDLAAALRLLDAGEYDALVVPRAELARAQAGRASVAVGAEVLYPPAGAGATVIRCRDGDDAVALLRLVSHPAAHACAVAEQAVADALPGDAGTLAAVHCAVRDQDEITLYAVMSLAGGDLAPAEKTGQVSDPEGLGTRVAVALISAAARTALSARTRFLPSGERPAAALARAQWPPWSAPRTTRADHLRLSGRLPPPSPSPKDRQPP